MAQFAVVITTAAVFSDDDEGLWLRGLYADPPALFAADPDVVVVDDEEDGVE